LLFHTNQENIYIEKGDNPKSYFKDQPVAIT